MKIFYKSKRLLLLSLTLCFFSCEDFLEIDPPTDKIVGEKVFQDDATALGFMTGIYNQLFQAFFSGGGPDSVTVLAGLSGDDLAPIRSSNFTYLEFEQHEIAPDNVRNLNLWSSVYNIIYMTNALLEGLETSNSLSENVTNQLEGEAKFIRAFSYFYLVNLYGETPLVLTTDYNRNALVSRKSQEEVYQQILTDLYSAKDLLSMSSLMGEKTQITTYTATALLARVQLYLENWKEAEVLSSELIESNAFSLVQNLDEVFLANSEEAIWQISPKGRGNIFTHTNEGLTFIIHPFLSFLSHIKLSDSLLVSFSEQDKRLLHWVALHQGTQLYYPFKYKIRTSSDEATEYSMVLRLAEQYLIRAEARAMQNDIVGAIGDVNQIRARAGVEIFGTEDVSMSQNIILEIIMDERHKELFSEWGHRWLDLKRTNKASEVFGHEPLWESTDMLYPIPETERILNPNLTQNNGY